MRIIAISSQKGGSGKTTLSGHLAVQASMSGAGPVALIDTDPQGSLSHWWNERQNDKPSFVQTSISKLSDDLEELKTHGFKTVIIDTPPAITTAIQAVVSLSDLVVIPTRPSPHDLSAAGATVDIVERAGKPLLFVINSATPRAKLTTEAAIALSQHGMVAPSIIHNRQDFAVSMIDGRTVMEMPKHSKSSDEIEALWSYVEERLHKVMPKKLFRHTAPRVSFGRRKTPVFEENISQVNQVGGI